jgi:ABC-type transport system involved in multi-copper enzyme maturation permease subunit
VSAAAEAEKPTEKQPRGVIRDRGYKPYEGQILDGGRWSLIWGRMLKMTARQPWVMVALIVSALPTVVYAVIMLVQAKMYNLAQANPAFGGALPSPDYRVYQLIAEPYGTLLCAFLCAMFAGGGAVADDARSGTFQFYFARPVTREHYLVGKLLPPVTLVALIALVPAILISILRIAITRDTSEAIVELLLPLRALALGSIEAVVLGVPVVALSSLSRGRGYVQGAFAALFTLPWILGAIFVGVTRTPWPAILSIPAHLQNLGHFLFALPLDEGERPLPVWLSAAVLGALVVGSIAILRKRLASVEVIAS